MRNTSAGPSGTCSRRAIQVPKIPNGTTMPISSAQHLSVSLAPRCGTRHAPPIASGLTRHITTAPKHSAPPRFRSLSNRPPRQWHDADTAPAPAIIPTPGRRIPFDRRARLRDAAAESLADSCRENLSNMPALVEKYFIGLHVSASSRRTRHGRHHRSNTAMPPRLEWH